MTTNTAALLRHLATILDILGAHRDANEGRDVWPSGLAFAGDRLGVAMGLDIEATWQEVATALRARADSLAPGLPEGWEYFHDGDGTIAGAVAGPKAGHWCGVAEGEVYIGGSPKIGAGVPIEVVRAVLARAQGVGS